MESHFITNTFGFQVSYKNTTASAQLSKNCIIYLTILTYYLNVAKFKGKSDMFKGQCHCVIHTQNILTPYSSL